MRPELFARQIEWLARKGYDTWPASRYVQALVERARLPDRVVVLTFDDGYTSVLEAALPILRARGACATVFLVTGAVGERPRWTTSVTEQVLTWEGARRAASDGLEFESHTHTHPFLDEASDECVQAEITRSRAELEARGLGRGRIIAWPYGRYAPHLRAAAIQAGYTAGFLDDFYWSHRRNPDLFCLNRIPVNPDLGVFGVAFSLGKGVEVWNWLRERLGPASRRRQRAR
ncbi:MAG TPA: polysaccharide deacetylase family protein [Candidatus Methylomirabilis sp.]|nr:polysaccharide deacetylase family protein [Candidatus Methylomirabilis sp.]